MFAQSRMIGVFSIWCWLACWSLAAEARPNIVLLLTDDQRADTIAALGNPAIKTPHLDRLANSGFVFRHAYCLGSNMPAVCTPSRNMLLSGRTYFRYAGPLAPAEQPNLARSLNDAGYETWHYGKRGNTAIKIQERFEHNRYLDDEADRTTGEPGKTIVDAGINFLADRDRQRPFFMLMAFANPHDPRVAGAEYRALYDEAEMPLPTNYLPVHPFDNGEMTVRDERLAPWPRTPGEIRRHLADYYAVLTQLDHHIGRFLTALGNQGLAGETIVIFTSDHGLAIGSHGLMGKQNLYEHSMKVPLIITGPGVPQATSSALVYLHDLLPTICELVGAPVPDSLDGQSLVPILRGGRAPRDTLFLAYRDVQRAVRDDRYKLIRYPQLNRTQLFDLESDPHELHDLSQAPEQQSRVATLTQRLSEWQARLGDHTPLSVDEPRGANFIPPAAGK
jgi:arylsulfatase A-like enzyme